MHPVEIHENPFFITSCLFSLTSLNCIFHLKLWNVCENNAKNTQSWEKWKRISPKVFAVEENAQNFGCTDTEDSFTKHFLTEIFTVLLNVKTLKVVTIEAVTY